MIKRYLITTLTIMIVSLTILPCIANNDEEEQDIDLFNTPLYITEIETNDEKIKSDIERQKNLVKEIIIDSKTLGQTIQNSIELNKTFDDLIIDEARLWKKTTSSYPALSPCYELEKEIISYLVIFKNREIGYIAELKVINKEIEKENKINATPVYQSEVKAYLYDRLIKTYVKLNIYNKLKYTDLLTIIEDKHQEQLKIFKTLNIPEHIAKQIEYLQRKEVQTAEIALNNLAEINKNIEPISSQLEEIDSIQNDIVTNIITDLKKQIKEYKNPKTNEINEQEKITNEAIEVLEGTIELYEILKKEIDKETKAYLPNNNILLAYDKENNNYQVPTTPPIWEQNKTTIDIISKKNETTIGPIPKTTIGSAKKNQQTNTGNTNSSIKTQKETQPSTFQQNVQWITNCFDAFDKEVTSSLTNGINYWTGNKPMTRKKREAIENGYTVGAMKFAYDSCVGVIRSIPENSACILDDRKSYTEKALCTTGLAMDLVPMAGTMIKNITNKLKTVSKKTTNLQRKLKNFLKKNGDLINNNNINIKGQFNKQSRLKRSNQSIKKTEAALNKQINIDKWNGLIDGTQNGTKELLKSFDIDPNNIFIESYKKIVLKKVENHVTEDSVTKDTVPIAPIIPPDQNNSPSKNASVGSSNITGQPISIPMQNPNKVVPIFQNNNDQSLQNLSNLVTPQPIQPIDLTNNIPNNQPQPPANFSNNPAVQTHIPDSTQYQPNQNPPVVPIITQSIGQQQQLVNPNIPPQYPPNNQPKADKFADLMNDLKQNQDNFNNNRGRQNIPQGGANNNQTANNFDTGFNDPNGMSNRINDLSSSTGGNNQPPNNPNTNNDPGGNVVNPPYKPGNNYQNNYDGSYAGTFKGNQSHAIDPRATQYGAQQGSYGSINYGAQNGIVAINWSGNISFTINGTNISGYIRINGINGKNQQWQGTIDLQSGQFRANDNTISGTINNNRASGIVAPSSTFEAYKQ